MSIAPLKKKTVKPAVEPVGTNNSTEILAENFINNGKSDNGQAKPTDRTTNKQDDHRLTLRIPKLLMDKIDIKRMERMGNISRNQLILEILDKALKK